MQMENGFKYQYVLFYKGYPKVGLDIKKNKKGTN